MSYAGTLVCADADSHLMEVPGWLERFAEPGVRERLRDVLGGPVAGVVAEARRRAEARVADAEARREAEERLLRDKGWSALGAFDPTERVLALDQLGFEAQLVFSTFATSAFLGRDLDLLYGGARAHNRAMAEFCAVDRRLRPVAYVPLADPVRAVSLAEEAIGLGCAAVMVPSRPAGDRSPSHPALEGFWGLLADAGVPFVLHVGGGGRLLDPRFHENGMPVPDHLGGGENVRSKDFLAIPHSPEVFLGVLVLDGVFDRFPGLRGGCMEQGAGWVVTWLQRLEYAVDSFSRTEEPLRRLARRPTEIVREHLKFTPFPGEPVGWMIEQAGAELFLFSSDFPHPEGGRDPIGKFLATMEGVGPEARERFFVGNFRELLGEGARVARPGA
ncbi:amidohydrolase family protein [Aciditerrimonas ferrireducens]|jgi:predicted TIM-barrel fold metal-dependent hydrolase|uniref:Amidohydrolase family protein n=1 Tax=Aciditerrimonas ferrireducens TaxID=667306 RepID=A0ABV6C4L0_9ACTN|nr:amidohydrolase family protein [Aciditerrimonas ferrireducens]MCK4177900.1 amidohydrolase [Aciditerrimonas ferrireducens]